MTREQFEYFKMNRLYNFFQAVTGFAEEGKAADSEKDSDTEKEFTMVNSDGSEKNHVEGETDVKGVISKGDDVVKDALRQAGLDDTVWVDRIQENLKLDSTGSLKSVARDQFELFVEQIEGPVQMALGEVYAKVRDTQEACPMEDQVSHFENLSRVEPNTDVSPLMEENMEDDVYENVKLSIKHGVKRKAEGAGGIGGEVKRLDMDESMDDEARNVVEMEEADSLETAVESVQLEERGDAEKADRNGQRQNAGQMQDETKQQRKPKSQLRKGVEMWLQKYHSLNEGNAHIAIKDLAYLKSECEERGEDWYEEVTSLRDVQNRLKWAAQLMSDNEQKEDMTVGLKVILQSSDDSQTHPFPYIREITERIKQVENASEFLPFKLKYIIELATHLKEKLKKDENSGLNLRELQGRLESTMRTWSRPKMNSHEYLVSIGVLHLFGYDISSHTFSFDLAQVDFTRMWEMLELHLRNYGTMRTKNQK